MLDYEAFRKEQAEARTAGRYLGVGVSNYVEPSTPGLGYYATEAATIRIEPSGADQRVHRGRLDGEQHRDHRRAAHRRRARREHRRRQHHPGRHRAHRFRRGRGRQPERVDDRRCRTRHGDDPDRTDRAIAAHKLEAAVDDIELAGSRATVRGTPAIGISLREIAALAYFEPYSLPPGVPAGLEASARYTAEAPVIWVNATHVCTCEVDVETGGVTLLRYIVSEDCGPMINPSVVEGQIAGGVVQGIGGALFENLAYDDDGNPLATTFMDYLVPSAAEVPMLEFGHIETPSAGPGGYKGVGEGGAIGAPPAVVNAVADALSPFGVKRDASSP